MQDQIERCDVCGADTAGAGESVESNGDQTVILGVRFPDGALVLLCESCAQEYHEDDYDR